MNEWMFLMLLFFCSCHFQISLFSVLSLRSHHFNYAFILLVIVLSFCSQYIAFILLVKWCAHQMMCSSTARQMICSSNVLLFCSFSFCSFHFAVSDISGDSAKAKQFLPFLQRAGRLEALVEFVASGSRVNGARRANFRGHRAGLGTPRGAVRAHRSDEVASWADAIIFVFCCNEKSIIVLYRILFWLSCSQTYSRYIW